MPATTSVRNSETIPRMSTFSLPDVRAFALIDSSSHRVATRRLLPMPYISLTGGKSIRKFHFYLFADPSARTRHVRALDIERKQSFACHQPSLATLPSLWRSSHRAQISTHICFPRRPRPTYLRSPCRPRNRFPPEVQIVPYQTPLWDP